MTSELRVEELNRVVTVTIDRPDRRNALSRSVLRHLAEVLEGDVTRDANGVILTGTAGHFSSGADFGDLTGTVDDVAFDDDVAAAVTAIQHCPRPVVAALSGACLGAAADLVLACDVRIADNTAYLQVPATRLGILYNPAAVLRLRRNLPADTVARLLLLGERFDAESAQSAGLVSVVVAAGTSVERAQAMLANLSADGRNATAATKALLADPDASHRTEHWEAVRRELLGSDARRRAVEQAHSRHTTHKGQGAQ